MNRKAIYEILEEDIGKTIVKLGKCDCCDRKYQDFFVGRKLTASDVGRHVYIAKGGFEIEDLSSMKKRNKVYLYKGGFCHPNGCDWCKRRDCKHKCHQNQIKRCALEGCNKPATQEINFDAFTILPICDECHQ